MLIMLINPSIPNWTKIKVYILWGFEIFGRFGVFILLIFEYSLGKSPVPTPIQGFFLIIGHEFIAKVTLSPTDEFCLSE